MKEKHPVPRDDSLGTQGTAYTAAEMALIAQIATGTVTRRQLEALFPGRTPGAVKKKIVEARHRLGLVADKPSPDREPETSCLARDDPGADDGWWQRHCRDMHHGNAAFLQALRAA